MKRKITIGIDQSIRFTGITVVYNDTSDLAFYGITNKIPSKWKKVSKADFSSKVEVREYTSIQKPDDYSEAEVVKFNNIYNIVTEIGKIFDELLEDSETEIEVRMEGISFSSRNTSSLAELSALNYLIREACYKRNIKFIILPPTKVKKFATGNGQADKELMTESFFVLNPSMREVSKYIKIDDIADSYFMAMYEE